MLTVNQITVFFYHQYLWKESGSLLDLFLRDKLYLSANQIAGFFDHQYLWKESVNILDCVHGDNHQRKAVSETTALVGYGQLCLLSNQIAGSFDHQYL